MARKKEGGDIYPLSWVAEDEEEDGSGRSCQKNDQRTPLNETQKGVIASGAYRGHDKELPSPLFPQAG
jgi:hypothetical protein